MDTPENDQFKPDKTHIEMWRHYDTLRQAKNSGFLTANSILVAITGLLFKEYHRERANPRQLSFR